MHFGEAFNHLASLASQELNNVLANQFADIVERAAAALIIAKRDDLSIECKVAWFLASWHTAPLDVRKYILEALGSCPSPEAVAFLKDNVADSEVRLAALQGLAIIGDKAILPICANLIQTGTETECRLSLGCLMTLGTNDAIDIVETALRLAPYEACRQRAAFLLALKGNSTGEAILEKKLSGLRLFRDNTDELESFGTLTIEPDYIHTCIALALINNNNGLVALKQLLDLLHNNHIVDRKDLIDLTLGIVRMPPTSSYEEWWLAMDQWIRERLKVE